MSVVDDIARKMISALVARPLRALLVRSTSVVTDSTWYKRVAGSRLGTTIRLLYYSGQVVVALGLIRWTIRNWRYIASGMLWKMSEPGRLPYELYRSEFTDTPIVGVRAGTTNPHHEAAGTRSTAALFARHVANRLGLRYYSVQMSANEQRKTLDGSRSYYWHKDLTSRAMRFNPPANSLVSLIDVDYYMDMPAFLTEQFMPTMIFTFVPEASCGKGPGFEYVFNSDQSVTMTINGGAKYNHHLWNYGTDNITVTRSLFGIPLRVSTYLVDRRGLDNHRQVIFLTPLRTFGILTAWMSMFLSGNRLTRLLPVFGDWVRLRVMGKTGSSVSTARVGSYCCCTTTSEKDSAIAALNIVSSQDVAISQVAAFVEDRSQATVMVDYLRSETVSKPPMVFPVDKGVRGYTVFNRAFEPGKPAVVPFMSPLVHGAFSPDVCLANERAMVDKRMVDVAAKEFLSPSSFLITCMEEFTHYVVPEPHIGHPTDAQEVFDRQDRPEQQRLLTSALDMVKPIRVFSSFMKKECYGGTKAPRPITTINALDKLEYSQFCYALANHMKQFEWYAFGRKPVEQAARVAYICSKAVSHACGTDCDKMDGRISSLLRELEKAIDSRFFHPQYHKQLDDLARSQYKQDAYTKGGIAYATGFQRSSGSPETSIKNTIVNAFINYYAFRLDGYSHDNATAALGMYGGDDGITADMDPERLATAASDVGQIIKAEMWPTGFGGVSFLARLFSPDVWYGDTSSCCDLRRQLMKFHVTVKLPANVTPAMKLIEKCRSFIQTDANTPVIGELCATVLRLATPEQVQAVEDAQALMHPMKRWDGAEGQLSVQYPNENNANWMVAVLRRDLPTFSLEKFLTYINECKSLDDVLKAPLCATVEDADAKFPVVVNGDVLPRTATIVLEQKRPAVMFGSFTEAERKSHGMTYVKSEPNDGFTTVRQRTAIKQANRNCKFGASCRDHKVGKCNREHSAARAPKDSKLRALKQCFYAAEKCPYVKTPKGCAYTHGPGN